MAYYSNRILPFGTLPEFAGYLAHDDQGSHQFCICARCLALNIHDSKFLFTPANRQTAVIRTEKLDAVAKLIPPTSNETRISTVVNKGEVQRIVRTLLHFLAEPNHIKRHLGTGTEEQAWDLIYPLFNRPRYLDITPGSVAEKLAFVFCGNPIIDDPLPSNIYAEHVVCWESVRATDNVLAVALATYRGDLFEPAPQHSNRNFY